MKEKKKYRVSFSFVATLEADDEADVLVSAAVDLKYHFQGVTVPSVSVIGEEIPTDEVSTPVAVDQVEPAPIPVAVVGTGKLHPIIENALSGLIPPRADAPDIPF